MIQKTAVPTEMDPLVVERLCGSGKRSPCLTLSDSKSILHMCQYKVVLKEVNKHTHTKKQRRLHFFFRGVNESFLYCWELVSKHGC